MRTKNLIIGVMAAGIFIISGILIGIGLNSSQNAAVPVPAPTKNHETAQHDYYPSQLPGGFTLDKASISKTEAVTAYTINYDSGKKLLVSIQSRPAQAVLDKFHKEQMTFVEPADTGLEKAFIGSVRGATTASIVAKKSWILITAPRGIDRAVLAQVVASYRPND